MNEALWLCDLKKNLHDFMVYLEAMTLPSDLSKKGSSALIKNKKFEV